MLTVVVDSNDDALSPVGRAVRVRRLRGAITFKLVDPLTAVDVARATARTKSGVPGDSASVLIN